MYLRCHVAVSPDTVHKSAGDTNHGRALRSPSLSWMPLSTCPYTDAVPLSYSHIEQARPTLEIGCRTPTAFLLWLCRRALPPAHCLKLDERHSLSLRH